MAPFDPNKLQVKNKMPAAIQITAEQILRDAVEWQNKDVKQTKQTFVDQDELTYYRAQKRKEFEDKLRRQRHHMGTWIQYAIWEANQLDFRRSRSVFERALMVDPNNSNLWLRYIEMEIKNKNVNSARNLFDRVVALLPRVDQFWFKYSHFEELLGNYASARNVFERWMEWNPEDKGWLLYIKFEERCNEIERCRDIFKRYLENRPSCHAFLKLVKFEEKHNNIPRARAAFVQCVEIIPADLLDEDFFIKFASFEERQRNYDGAERVYEQGLMTLGRDRSEELYGKFISFQKQYKDKESIDALVATKKRNEYEEKLLDDPQNYDLWFDYLRLEEGLATGESQKNRVSELYERAIANFPQVDHRRVWRRYSYLWVNYAVFSEMVIGDLEKSAEIYTKALTILPKDFAKFYILLAEVYLRMFNLDKMRKVYGQGLGLCKKPKLFENYAQTELKLGNIERCRLIYAKYIETWPFKPQSWISMLDLELMLCERRRVRGICEAAIEMEQMELPELLWNKYIEIEKNWNELSNVRNLYERLLLKTTHIKVFKEYSMMEYESGSLDHGRNVIERGLEMYKTDGLNVERALLLAHYSQMEKQFGTPESIERIKKRQAKKVRRKRKLENDQTIEDIVYVFPDDGPQQSNILQAALKWKMSLNKD